MTLRPLHDQVIVKREKFDEHADSDIIAIADTGRMSIFGRVVAVGPKVTQLAEGDRIVIPGWNGKKLTMDGDELLALREEEIPAVVE